MSLASQADRLAVLCRDAAVLASDLQRLLVQAQIDSAETYVEKMTAADQVAASIPKPIAPDVQP